MGDLAGTPEPVAPGRAGTDAPTVPVGVPGADAGTRYALALVEYRAIEAAIDDGTHPCLAGLDGDDDFEDRMRACRAVVKPWWDRLDALRRETEAEPFPLSLARLPRPLLEESAVLGERIYLCADEDQAETVKGSGPVTYTAAEVRDLLCAGATAEGLRTVHAVKRFIPGRIAETAPGAAPSACSPWPDALPDLGPRRVGPFTPCARCGVGSWVRYGETVLCLSCATSEAAAVLLGALSRAAGTGRP